MSLSNQAALHWLQNMRVSDWWQSQMPISDMALSRAMGKHPSYVRKHLDPTSGYDANVMLDFLSRLIPDIEARKLVFPIDPGGRVKGERPPRFMWCDPQPVTIPRLGKAWSLWAECSACRGNQFLPVIIDSKEHYACYHCLHPTQYRSVGAQPVKKSLIHEALKQYY